MPDQLDQPLPDNRLRWLRRTHPARASRSDGFGRFAEATARFMGSPQFVLYMSIFVFVWIVANLLLAKTQGEKAAWDPYPFILLNLAFSTQASYSAPLIMLAQNRQDDRDRVTAEQDRQRAQRNLEDTEFLTREIAALRLAMNDVATRDFVRSELRDMLSEILAEERLTREEITEIAEFQEGTDGEPGAQPGQHVSH
ncbi:DUF1003 domain-containing protein [Actinomyces viscosus]|uniref:Predicted membrane protein n=2 Tax=Bacteria TaxID=2 RepID=A0A3S4Z6T0_ACTVI|nr:DUF1003 domain-containing protein [Actinomyces viscosus]TFH53619.1 DUF1003 domain-containing protein [Actinomyces viscosus]VEI14343.1 Predicted membrane protein [Actinomyces viscosus]